MPEKRVIILKHILDWSKPCCKYFEDICKLPHGSGNEKALSDFLVSFAEERNLWVMQDDIWNVIIKKPATEGYENAKPVMLQSHIDMVCEKNIGLVYDFESQPLDLRIDNGWLKAGGTTLGADDGCGVAYMMDILDDKTMGHPALECVFTVQEETGMGGAKVLDFSKLTATRMISLDSAGETSTLLSTAGGMRLKIVKQLELVQIKGELCAFGVRGLEGGHSGVFIHKERGNSIKIAARILNRLRAAGVDYNLADISGGSKDNAIPRESTVVFACGAHQRELAEQVISDVGKEIKDELKTSDSGFFIKRDIEARADKMMSENCTAQLVNLLYLVPNAVANMSMSVEGLVQTSDNVGVLELEGDRAILTISLRSAVESQIDDLSGRIELLCDLCGARYEKFSRYPAMPYLAESKLRSLLRDTMMEVWGQELTCSAAHAGGEGGYFCANIPNLELISIGPFIEDVHCPDERMNVKSFERVGDFLKVLISRIKE